MFLELVPPDGAKYRSPELFECFDELASAVRVGYGVDTKCLNIDRERS